MRSVRPPFAHDDGHRRHPLIGSGPVHSLDLPVSRDTIDPQRTRNARLGARQPHAVRSVAAHGHSLGLRGAAEGGETIDDLARARLYGFDDILGVLISPKRSADGLMTMLARWSEVEAPVVEAGAGHSGS